MLAFAPGQMCVALPTTKETAITCGDRLDYVRLVNESNTVQTVTTVDSSGSAEMGSIRLQPGEIMILWKRESSIRCTLLVQKSMVLAEWLDRQDFK